MFLNLIKLFSKSIISDIILNSFVAFDITLLGLSSGLYWHNT